MNQHHQQRVRENVYRKILERHQVIIPEAPHKQFQEGYILHCRLQRIGLYWKDGF